VMKEERGAKRWIEHVAMRNGISEAVPPIGGGGGSSPDPFGFSDVHSPSHNTPCKAHAVLVGHDHGRSECGTPPVARPPVARHLLYGGGKRKEAKEA
jgi:hypothetical protein